MTDRHPTRQLTVDAALDAIERLNPTLNAVLHAQAQPALEPGRPTLPVLVKDCMHVRGMPTTYGSAIFCDGPAAGEDATVVGRLRSRNATIVGKAHLTEFCFGATGQNDYFGNCKNPWDIDRITGGSSSGSAAAVASGIVRMALGTDTGGSDSVPAALCGVVWLRPTIGRVPNTGCLEVSTISDTIGPLAATVEEACWLFDAIQGYDAADPLSVATAPATLPTLEDGVQGLTIGRLGGFFAENVDPAIEERITEVATLLESQGARLTDTLPENDTAVREHHAFRFILADVAEARKDLMADPAQRAMIGAEVRRRIELGQQVSGTDYASSIRSLLMLKQWLRAVFDSGVDLLLLPTTPVTAPLWRDSGDMVATTRLVARFTYDLGATGIPSISVPMGLDARGLPMGAMLAATWGNEAVLMRAARAVERGLSLAATPPVHAG
jgi:aspartyl-tRNA(Asn)/glutamyl-tRNA(Gln) amidotransferase subunit A